MTLSWLSGWSIRLASARHPTGIRPTSDRHPTGIRPTSDRYPTGIRPTSDRYPTGIRPVSDRYPTGVRKVKSSIPVGDADFLFLCPTLVSNTMYITSCQYKSCFLLCCLLQLAWKYFEVFIQKKDRFILQIIRYKFLV